MDATLIRSRLLAFSRSDVDHAPFGIDGFRGLTPARMAVVGVLCLTLATVEMHMAFANAGITGRVFVAWMRSWAIIFTAATPVMLMIIWADRLTSRMTWRVRVGGFVAATIVGALAFAAIMTSLAVVLFNVDWRAWPHYPLIPVHFYRAALAGALLSAVLFFAAREREAGAQLLRSRLTRVAAERQIAEARLQLLNAQIEPHFLFNSLASVKRLYEEDARGGRDLLRNMNVYLRSAIVRSRERETILVEQVAMARSFLEIFRQRMGERLRIHIEIPPRLETAMVPPLMLGTLVENAVKHGVGPRSAGGSIRLEARNDGNFLILEVIDDGVGLREEAGRGVGLANTRARLESLYGADGDLDLRSNPDGGVTAALRIPLRYATADGRPLVHVAEDASPEPAETGFLGRFRRALSWKHWAWAVGIGVLVGALDRLRTFASPFNMWGIVWIEETALAVVAACVFMMAIVAVEASRPQSRMSFAKRYFLGWLAGAVLVGAISWTYDFDTSVRADHPMAARMDRMMKKMTQQSPLKPRVMALFGIGGVIIVHGALGMLVYVWLRNSRLASEALAKAEVERAEAERKLVASRLDAVEAEVDPGFMFSTLESIEQTYDRDRAAADAMLDELIGFLRAAIPKLRNEEAANRAEAQVQVA